MGASSVVNVRSRPAPSERISLRPSAEVVARPSSVLTTIGKKQISATIATFGPIPKPNQTTRIGAMTMIGIVWEATTSG